MGTGESKEVTADGRSQRALRALESTLVFPLREMGAMENLDGHICHFTNSPM